MQPIAKLILDSIGEEAESSYDSKLGSFFFQVLKREAPESSSVFSFEVDEKVSKMRELENIGDLCWLDFFSWNSFNRSCQEKIKKLLNPLFLSCVCFQYSLWLKHYIEILFDLDCGYCVFELRDFGNYRIVCFRPNTNYYIWMREYDFNNICQIMDFQLCRSFGFSGEGSIVIKNYDKKNSTDIRVS